jgi:type III secretory pathway component EscR
VNQKIMKKINRQVEVISVEWLRSIMSEEEADKITKNNFRQYLNQTAHYFKNKQFFNSSFTEKWTRKKLKKLFRRNPSRPIDSYKYSDLA